MPLEVITLILEYVCFVYCLFYCPGKFREYLYTSTTTCITKECQESDCFLTGPQELYSGFQECEMMLTQKIQIKLFTNKFLIKSNPIREHATRKF